MRGGVYIGMPREWKIEDPKFSALSESMGLESRVAYLASVSVLINLSKQRL
jgi:hypothetical protein